MTEDLYKLKLLEGQQALQLFFNITGTQAHAQAALRIIQMSDEDAELALGAWLNQCPELRDRLPALSASAFPPARH